MVRLARAFASWAVAYGAVSLCVDVRADDYRLHPSPTFTQGTAHIAVDYPLANDSKVCQTYLDNLRYFARRNTEMSCARPIAPHPEKVIRPVEWEDLDPVAYAALLSSVIARASFVKNVSQQALESATAEIRAGTRVFRRITTTFSGTFDDGKHGPKPAPEPFQVMQYGMNYLGLSTPGYLRCEPRRGGPEVDQSYLLQLYLVSPDLKQVHDKLYNYMGGGPTGAHLRWIRGNLYVEHVATDGNSILMQLRTEFPIGLESICLYHFTMDR